MNGPAHNCPLWNTAEVRADWAFVSGVSPVSPYLKLIDIQEWERRRTAGLSFQVHSHMLRHAAGYKLAGDGHDTRSIQDYLGHKNIQHSVRYTELSPTKFKDFWRN